MKSSCPMDGETLSRFLDHELPPSEFLETEAHLSGCPSCSYRADRFRLADGLMSAALATPAPEPRSARLVASLSVAAALVVSIVTNLLLTPRVEAAIRPGLRLSAAPSQTLTSFYEKVAPQGPRP